VHLIDIVDGARSPRVELWVGLHDSAHATALGKQILADLPADDRLDYLSRHPLSELTQHTISDRRILLGQLETPRPWTVDREEYAIGFTCVAVPVSAPDVTASLAVSLPSSTTPERAQQVVARLRRVSASLSLQLGADRFGQFTI
jgi:DNA-binding IclR family transcriptional regulator